jgi:HK97 family phage portal protein
VRLFGLEITRAKALVPAPVRGGWTGSLFGFFGDAYAGAWQREVKVDNAQTLLAQSAVYACISRIATDISIMRPMLMRIEGGPSGIWSEIYSGQESRRVAVLKKPNRYQTRQQFLTHWITSKLMFGNAYILKERDNRGGTERERGMVSALYPLDSRYVKPLIADDGSVWYEIAGDALSGLQTDVRVPASEVIHDRCTTLWHPLVGVSPLFACALSATQGRRIQTNSAKFFENMSRPSGMLTAPGKIDPETAKRMKDTFEQLFSGPNLGRLFVGGDGLKYEPMTMPAEAAQLIEQLKWTVEDVARAFRVPLHKLQAGTLPGFSNIGALNQDYLSQCLQEYIEAVELLLTEGLGLSDDMGVALEEESLLRMDPKTRAETIEILMRSGTLAPNEARRRENLPAVEGGNSPMIQQQNFSLAALAKRDAQEDPFGTAKPAAAAPADTPPEDPDDPQGAEDRADAKEGNGLARVVVELRSQSAAPEYQPRRLQQVFQEKRAA